MDVDAYLHRIGAVRPTAPTDGALADLHSAHVRTVPFEDYDIHLGVPISLDPTDLHDKIVTRGRGGYCYELNGLFAELLRALGYDVVLVSAFEVPDGPEFDHLHLLVDGRWIADVGNGSVWHAPVPLRVGVHGDVAVHRDGERWWNTQRRHDGEWEPGWAWTAQPRELVEFTDRCRYQEHSPDSHFTQRRIAARATDRGRITLVNGLFAEVVDGVRSELRLDAEQERTVLRTRFVIDLPAITR